MPYKITVFYDESTEKNALDTFKDLERELSAWGIPYKNSNGKIKKVKVDAIEVAFANYNPHEFAKGKPPDVMYTTETIKTRIASETDYGNAKIVTHERPFQDLVNIVLEIRNLVENAHALPEAKHDSEQKAIMKEYEMDKRGTETSMSVDEEGDFSMLSK